MPRKNIQKPHGEKISFSYLIIGFFPLCPRWGERGGRHEPLLFAVKMRNLHSAASGPERGNLRLAQDVTRGK